MSYKCVGSCIHVEKQILPSFFFCFMLIILVSLFIRSVLLLSMNSESRRLALTEAGSSKILWRILPEQRLICSMVYLRLVISQFVKELTLSFSVVSIFCS